MEIVCSDFASQFADMNGEPKEAVVPVVSLIEEWHRHNPLDAAEGVMSFDGMRSRKQGKRLARKEAKQEKRARARCAKYVTKELKARKQSVELSGGNVPTAGIMTWISIACWAWSNRELIKDLIKKIRELLVDIPTLRERVMS